MPTRADLLATAEGLASAARRAVGDGGSMTGADVAAGYANAAKAALEAAALAEDVGAGEVAEALDKIQDLLAEGGVLDKAIELPPAEFLEQTFRALLSWREETLNAQGFEVAYDRIRELCERLERDFIAGDTDTSRRIAGRIRVTLDEATEIVNHHQTRGASNGDDHSQ